MAPPVFQVGYYFPTPIVYGLATPFISVELISYEIVLVGDLLPVFIVEALEATDLGGFGDLCPLSVARYFVYPRHMLRHMVAVYFLRYRGVNLVARMCEATLITMWARVGPEMVSAENASVTRRGFRVVKRGQTSSLPTAPFAPA